MSTGPLDRVLRSAGTDTLELLAVLPGADLTTLLLEVMRRRAAGLAAPDVLRQYRADRFVAPAEVSFARLRAAENAALSAVPGDFALLTLSPVTPLGTHSVLGAVHQNNVVSTVRRTEVAADPTNGLALEAADRRAARPDADVRLAALQRVVRAQVFTGPASFAHFTLLAAVSAGRDPGNLAFERRHAVEHIRLAADAVRAATGAGALVRLTAWDSRYRPVLDAVRAALPDVELVDDPDREPGRGYYTGFCFKVFCRTAGEPFDVGDGGLLGWTAALLGNRKERLISSGLGIDRLASA
ncbi:MAG TPA: hypothetical protein VGX25_04380 [Actinophytocola sp.]|uniref:hypothetical protein n=1 Tax=Actinophytocola sp. TaxID=1872138 RepID=UPI002DDCA19D|nr:hypothetical protein [Actinophytocola sp.]HEV2778617.1 hypothetical protein [Actinophytocola sp.]